MRKYYLHQRKGVFYAQLVTPEGHRTSARSTKKTSKDEALLVVSQWLSKGIPKRGTEKPVEQVLGLSEILKSIRKVDLDSTDALKIVEALKKRDLVDFNVTKAGSGSKLFVDFLTEFWDWNSSVYVKERLSQKKNSIGKRHCYSNQDKIRCYYSDYFAGKTLDAVSWQDLRDFGLFLSTKREKPKNYRGNFAEELSASSKNAIMILAKTALRWAYAEELISTDPTAKKKIRFSGDKKKRGVLTPQEAETVFNKVQWDDKRSYVGNLLAITTGMRSGEVLALRKSDIGDNILYLRHSWCSIVGLKTPKNGEEGTIPLLPKVKEALLELLCENPHNENDPFVFYSTIEGQPMDRKILLNGLISACKAAGVDAKARNIVVHSHRHFYAARLTDKMAAEQVRRITRHKTAEVFEEYADHPTDKNFEDMAAATAEVFEKIIPFRKVG